MDRSIHHSIKTHRRFTTNRKWDILVKSAIKTKYTPRTFMKSIMKPAVLLTLCFSSISYAISNPSKVADIVGRDLDAPVISSAGHVGIWTGSEVLEVMNSSAVIEENSLLSFKAATSYWGAKTAHNGRFAWEGQRNHVIHFGRQQQKFNPEYTFSASYREGQWGFSRVYNETTKKWENKQYVKVTAKFRCDSFVRFAFRKADVAVPSSGPLTPSTLFNQFGPSA